MDEIIGNYQSGFRKNKSSTDYSFIIRQIMEKRYEYTTIISINIISIIDYKQAYDTV